MTEVQSVTAFNAFENQLKTLCLHEFPCGIGRLKENFGKKRKQIEKDKVNSRFVVTLKDYGVDYEKTETLEELVISKDSPWNLDYSWSNEAKQLREIAVRSPWLIDERFVLSHFSTLRIVDKDVTDLDEHFLKFSKLKELSLSANRIRTVNSRNLPASLEVLELCANEISTLADLCMRPPEGLRHLGLGYNSITLVDEYITGEYWPSLLSLDLSHNNLCDMMDIVRKLQTLPKLRNLILQGNPLTFIPGYRGYTIDSLRKLSFLDDISISADEKHHFKGLAKRKEYILDEAKMVLHVGYIKGVPVPEETKNPEEQPQYPVVTRRYFVQFMFLEEKAPDTEIFEIIHDDEMSTLDPSSHATQTPSLNTARTSDVEQADVPPEAAHADVTDVAATDALPPALPSRPATGELPNLTVTAPTEADQMTQRPESQLTQQQPSDAATPDPDQTTPRAIKLPLALSPVNSAMAPWADDIQLNWTKTVARDDLLAFRDFLKQGMQILVMEEKVDSYPADQFQQEESVSPAPSSKSKDGKKGDKKADKKDDKAKDKGKDDKAPPKREKTKDRLKEGDEKAKAAADKGGDKKGKKKGEPEIEMVSMAPEFRTLATFHVPLADFLDGEFQFENVYVHDGVVSAGTCTPAISEISSKNKGKDKKKPGSAKKKDAKPEKDGRVKSGKKEEKKDKKDDKGKGKDGGKAEAEEDPSTPPPPLEIFIRVKLTHWKTAMDSMKADEGSEEQEAGDEQ